MDEDSAWGDNLGTRNYVAYLVELKPIKP